MYLFRLTFLVLLLAGSLRESDAFEARGDERSSHPPAAVHVKEDADASKKDPSPSEQCHLVQRLAKRKPDASALSFATQNVPLSINSRSFGCRYRSSTVGEDDLIALYQFLRVYRC